MSWASSAASDETREEGGGGERVAVVRASRGDGGAAARLPGPPCPLLPPLWLAVRRGAVALVLGVLGVVGGEAPWPGLCTAPGTRGNAPCWA